MKTLRAALWLLVDITLPSIRRHRVRTLLTVVGVVIGTQVVVAVLVLNRTILASFTHTIDTIAGEADLQVSNGPAGVPEALIEAVAHVPGVAKAAGLIQGTLGTEFGDLAVFGVDLLGDQGIRETQFPKRYVHIPDALRFANNPDSIALSQSVAERARLTVDSQIQVTGPAGRETMTVRGLLDPVGPAALFGGAVAVVDLPTAQRLFGRGERVDQIDIALADDHQASVSAILPQLTAIVGDAGSIEPPGERGARLGSMLASVQTVLTLVGVFAIVVGAFIIHHTMETAIAHRRREFALARALGYHRRAVVAAIGAEALAYGVVGSLAGVVFGLAGAKLSLAIATTGVGAIWGRVDVPRLTVAAKDLSAALALGIGSTLAAGLLAGLQASRMQIVDQLHEGTEVALDAAVDWRAVASGLLLNVTGYGLLASGIRPYGFTQRVALIMAGVVLLALGYTCLAPLLVRVAAFVARTVSARLQPPAFALASDSIARDPSRTRGALAALMLAFAMVLIVGTFVRSLRTSIVSWVTQTFSADLRVSPGLQLPLPSGPTLVGSLEPELRSVAGVVEVIPVRMVNVQVGDGIAVLRTTSFTNERQESYRVVEGDLSESMRGVLAAGDAVLVSDNLAYRQNLRAGDQLSLDTAAGRRAFTIAAVVVDYTLDVGTIVMDHHAYKRLWQDDLVNTFLVWLAPGTDINEVRSAVSRRLNVQVPVSVITGREFNTQIAGALDAALLLTYAIQLVAIAIAVIGVVNFFLAEILDRRREIGLLRAVALTRRQLLQTFATEAMILGTLGGMLAALYAWPVAQVLVTRSTRIVSGWSLAFEFPVGLTFATIAVSALTATAAAYYPARRAANAGVADLIRVE